MQVGNYFYVLGENFRSKNIVSEKIPIVVEGKGSTNRVADEEQEKLDNFNTSSIQRHRWGSRKKRMSSAFSDSSMSDDEALNTPFGGGQNQGLQKGFSYGKHGPGEGHNYTLKKTRPPFAETVDPISVAQSVKGRAQEKSERSIPINIQRQNSQDSPVSSKPGTPLHNNPGVYNTHMKPFSPTPTNENSGTRVTRTDVSLASFGQTFMKQQRRAASMQKYLNLRMTRKKLPRHFLRSADQNRITGIL